MRLLVALLLVSATLLGLLPWAAAQATTAIVQLVRVHGVVELQGVPRPGSAFAVWIGDFGPQPASFQVPAGKRAVITSNGVNVGALRINGEPAVDVGGGAAPRFGYPVPEGATLSAEGGGGVLIGYLVGA